MITIIRTCNILYLLNTYQVQHLDAFDIDDWSIPLTNIPLPSCS